MNKKTKNIIVSISFISVLIGFSIVNLLIEDKYISYSERRKLKQLPNLTVERLLNGEYFGEIENYLQDQFILRDDFRYLKAFTNFKLLNQKDNSGIYLIDNNIYQMSYKFNEKSVYNAAKIYNKISSKYFKDDNIYYTIIPDKNYFVPKDRGYLSLDYDKMTKIMEDNTENMKYINIMNDLNIDDYYKTDLHWRQDKIIKIADKILLSMGKDKVSSYNYRKKEFYPFYGSYYGQGAIKVEPDKLIYLTNNIMENCKVYDSDNKEYRKIYKDAEFNDVDSYNIFLGGPKAILEIENKYSENNNELYIFRDSFGSSIAPLLVSEYSKITLIDLRYISSTLLEKYLNPKENSDVLFMYNTLILNDSSVISR
ncbi:MAG: DHHW family protein [Turicibacter sp.]|nr:DHHW family protein [Turicibacter sp.]